MQIINPATEAIIDTVEEDGKDSLLHKFQVLTIAQKAWAAHPLSDRLAVISRFHALLESEQAVLVATLTAEAGKPLQQSVNEINGASTRIQWILSHAAKYLEDEYMTDTAGMKEKISYEPLGVICNISAWNYPWLVGVNVFIPALIAGNAVMYKPSEYATLTGFHIARLLKMAGLPDGVFQVAIGGKGTGENLLDMDFAGYFFTGSYQTGKHIYERVARKMVPCQLELGGKDPVYVMDDVKDIKNVAAGTADGAFYNNGQSCCAVERIYVHEKIYDEYLNEFVKEVKSWKTGDPTEAGVYTGPLTRKEQLDELEKQVVDAVQKGASLLTGGKRIPGKGYYFEPTVFTNVTHEMRLMKEESFGPIIGIMKVKNDEEALALMQDTPYGLTAAVYSADRERAAALLQQVNSGTSYWNCCDRVSAAVPWSGRKHSGIGVTLSHQGIRAFTKTKSWHLRG
ncbi:acyl-CoA reductase-like NAD-dependent aldehyde dehydrogenase [Chitinophaga niastensis]|uniref:Acyl-CoA reductase-like NAD-dependent aldehyde dehydrogenase n=1 Tax=Chitinophaga niastensis TaxID=536980 RepID=A0A2P8HCS9_CHINA|nr:aldehyde dehydrogenase family protein [Chitinophaga niastensis]PSL43921.1 acyl-CoA reductase-like NAD-dependent aldehyde dehydrogenase [Chitinophaga niastensis]